MHTISFADVYQTASGDNFVHTTFSKSLPCDISPSYQQVGEFIIFTTECSHFLTHNSLFNCGRWIFLFICIQETLKEGFVQNVGEHITAVIRAFTFCVSRGDNGKALSRCNQFILLFQQEWFAFQNTLETGQILCTIIDFVNTQYSALAGCYGDGTITPFHLTIDQHIVTKQVTLIGIRCH